MAKKIICSVYHKEQSADLKHPLHVGNCCANIKHVLDGSAIENTVELITQLRWDRIVQVVNNLSSFEIREVERFDRPASQVLEQFFAVSGCAFDVFNRCAFIIRLKNRICDF